MPLLVRPRITCPCRLVPSSSGAGGTGRAERPWPCPPRWRILANRDAARSGPTGTPVASAVEGGSMATDPVYTRRFGEFGIEDIPTVGGQERRDSARCTARCRPRGCGSRTASPSPPTPTGTSWTRPGPRDRCTTPSTGSTPPTWPTSPEAARARAIVYDAGPARRTWPPRSWPRYRHLRQEYGTGRRAWPSAPRPRPRTCRRRASPASRRPSSTSGATTSLLEACRRCFASLFTDRAIHYRVDKGFDQFKVALSIGVMKMVRSDLAASGVHVHPRHRVRVPRRRLRDRRLRPGRERRAGRGRPRRVLRPQAEPGRRPPCRPAAPAR